MKLITPAALVMMASVPDAQAYSSRWEAQQYDGSSILATQKMWVFAQDGLHIFSADGEELLVRGEKKDVCHSIMDPWSPPGTIQDECWHMDPVMDGENYVFVANNNYVEDGFVDVFSMWTGRKLTSIPICSLPYHMEYSPNRKELWVECWLRPSPENSSNSTDKGSVEVISTQALGAIPISVDTRGVDAHHHGEILIDISIPDKAYEFSFFGDSIYEIHTGSKEVVKEIAIQNTVATYEHAYSAVNKHIFIRTYGCCACGETKDTRAPCEWDQEVLVEYGPNKSPIPQIGYCGKFCRGSLADVNGLWEFDTQTNTHVAQHLPANGAHGAKPFASPLGEYILIGAGDGGNSVKVLKPGKNGQRSVDVGVINLNFGADAGTHAFSDVDFIEGQGRNIAVFTSTLNNHVVLVDMSAFDRATEGNPVTVDGVDLELFESQQEDDISVKHDIRGINIRQVRWATGTDYVWVSSPLTEQVHVIQLGEEIQDSIVVRTIDDIDNTRHFLWVHNYEQDALQMQSEATVQQANAEDERITSLEDDTNLAMILGYVGIGLGGLALLLTLVNLARNKNNANAAAANATTSEGGKDAVSSTIGSEDLVGRAGLEPSTEFA